MEASLLLSKEWIREGIWLAGLSQLALVAASLAIPRVLRWKEELAKLSSSLLRQVFWVYSAYIWTTNLSFGLLSVFAPEWLLTESPLAGAVSGFIALYWASRFFIQIFYFGRKDLPAQALFKLGDLALTLLFVFLSLVYAIAAYFNFK